MTTPPLDSTHGRTTSGVTCHHLLWTAHTVGRRRAWRAIISLKKHRRSDGVRRGMPSSPLESTNGKLSLCVTCHHSPWTAHTVGNVGQGIKSPPLDSTHGQTTSSMAKHHRPWTARTIGRRWALHDITALGQHTAGNVVRGMTSPPLDNTHGRQRRAWHDITALG